MSRFSPQNAIFIKAWAIIALSVTRLCHPEITRFPLPGMLIRSVLVTVSENEGKSFGQTTIIK